MTEVFFRDNRSWAQFAACKDMDINIFYVEQGAAVTEAKAICAGCPVREECLEYALSRKDHEGVWGGTTRMQRREILRQRRKADVALQEAV